METETQSERPNEHSEETNRKSHNLFQVSKTSHSGAINAGPEATLQRNEATLHQNEALRQQYEATLRISDEGVLRPNEATLNSQGDAMEMEMTQPSSSVICLEERRQVEGRSLILPLILPKNKVVRPNNEDIHPKNEDTDKEEAGDRTPKV